MLNVCEDPTFEVEPGEAVWFSRLGTEALTYVTTQHHTGTGALQVVTPGTDPAEGAWSFTHVPAGIAGREVIAQAWVKGASGSVSISTITRQNGSFEGFFDYATAVMDGTWKLLTATARQTTAISDQIEVAIGPDDSGPQALTYYIDDVLLSCHPIPRTYRRLYGPNHLESAAHALYVAPALTRATIRHILLSNPSGSPVTVTLSIGVDGASTRLLDAKTIPAGGEHRVRKSALHTLAPGEQIQAFASTAGVVVAIVDGVEEDFLP